MRLRSFVRQLSEALHSNWGTVRCRRWRRRARRAPLLHVICEASSAYYYCNIDITLHAKWHSQARISRPELRRKVRGQAVRWIALQHISHHLCRTLWLAQPPGRLRLQEQSLGLLWA